MTIPELAKYCKLLSDPDILFILKTLMDYPMMSYKTIGKVYTKYINATTDRNLPDSKYQKLIDHKLIKTDKYGIMSLTKNVDKLGFILVYIDNIKTKLPDLFNYGDDNGYYVTDEQRVVYVVRNANGVEKAVYLTLNEAEKAKKGIYRTDRERRADRIKTIRANKYGMKKMEDATQVESDLPQPPLNNLTNNN